MDRRYRNWLEQVKRVEPILDDPESFSEEIVKRAMQKTRLIDRQSEENDCAEVTIHSRSSRVQKIWRWSMGVSSVAACALLTFGTYELCLEKGGTHQGITTEIIARGIGDPSGCGNRQAERYAIVAERALFSNASAPEKLGMAQRLLKQRAEREAVVRSNWTNRRSQYK